MRPALTVFYDGSCPLCSREIGLYQRARGSETIRWHDLAIPEKTDLPDGLTLDDALARFHVLSANGKLVSGADGFVALWLALPGWRWLGRIVSIWPLTVLAEGLYRIFLRFRPQLQRWFRG